MSPFSILEKGKKEEDRNPKKKEHKNNKKNVENGNKGGGLLCLHHPTKGLIQWRATGDF